MAGRTPNAQTKKSHPPLKERANKRPGLDRFLLDNPPKKKKKEKKPGEKKGGGITRLTTLRTF